MSPVLLSYFRLHAWGYRTVLVGGDDHFNIFTSMWSCFAVMRYIDGKNTLIAK